MPGPRCGTVRPSPPVAAFSASRPWEPTIAEAREAAYAAADVVHFDGMQMRRDIALSAASRAPGGARGGEAGGQLRA